MSKYKPKARIVPLGSAAWKRLRAQVLVEEPLCRWCLARGWYVASTDVDHIKDSREDYSDDNRRENLTAMCHECHSVKTALDMGKSTTPGHDINGFPIDPGHHWNLENAPDRCKNKGLRRATECDSENHQQP